MVLICNLMKDPSYIANKDGEENHGLDFTLATDSPFDALWDCWDCVECQVFF